MSTFLQEFVGEEDEIVLIDVRRIIGVRAPEESENGDSGEEVLLIVSTDNGMDYFPIKESLGSVKEKLDTWG